MTDIYRTIFRKNEPRNLSLSLYLSSFKWNSHFSSNQSIRANAISCEEKGCIANSQKNYYLNRKFHNESQSKDLRKKLIRNLSISRQQRWARKLVQIPSTAHFFLTNKLVHISSSHILLFLSLISAHFRAVEAREREKEKKTQQKQQEDEKKESSKWAETDKNALK